MATRSFNLALIVPILFSTDCGARSSLDTAAANMSSEPSSGGATAAVSAVSTGGIQASSGGFANSGGRVTTGGMLSAGGSTGCTGSFELVIGNVGPCVAKMVPITGPLANQDYKIDATEVTRGQYDAWLATNPALPESTDADCGYVTSYAEQGPSYGGIDAAHNPVVHVDWCDAYAYCKAIGKRLCGRIGGGSNGYSDYKSATLSQWYNACSSGGANQFPYAGGYQSTACNGADSGKGMMTVVGSLGRCQAPAPFAGIYDLSGNVWEWEDSCMGTGESASCHIRGGSWRFDSSALTCAGDFADTRSFVYSDAGFRCCSQ